MASSANDADDAPFSLDHGDTRDKETTVLDIKDSDITYSVWVSFCETYQDSCYDLLSKVQDSNKGVRETLRLC